MVRSRAEHDLALYLVDLGLNDCQIGRIMSVPRGTIRDWRHPKYVHKTGLGERSVSCPICQDGTYDKRSYAYLLGLYLGDGCISRHPRAYRLRITLDDRYHMIIAECCAAVDEMRGHGLATLAGLTRRTGCVEVGSYWQHWPSVFPQHGPGPKHLRPIRLADWQRDVVEDYPDRLLRGLIHSDGCRALNRVNGTVYPRYQFSNNSRDIQAIFCDACDRLDIQWERSFWKTISVSRRASVGRMDQFIGPKA